MKRHPFEVVSAIQPLETSVSVLSDRSRFAGQISVAGQDGDVIGMFGFPGEHEACVFFEKAFLG